MLSLFPPLALSTEAQIHCSLYIFLLWKLRFFSLITRLLCYFSRWCVVWWVTFIFCSVFTVDNQPYEWFKFSSWISRKSGKSLSPFSWSFSIRAICIAADNISLKGFYSVFFLRCWLCGWFVELGKWICIHFTTKLWTCVVLLVFNLS